ncbi:hypothetical protein [Devosia riboflavina]
MSDDWRRIGDNDFAGFGRMELTARRSDTGEIYVVFVDDADQDEVRFAYRGVELVLDVQRKFILPEGVYSLSGGLNDRENLFGIERHAWVELLLTAPAMLSYWGNAVLLRQDFASVCMPIQENGSTA